jgi:hypothetical protein
MSVNWGLETRKWQIALREMKPLPFGVAFKAVITGVTIGSFTPNRMGEYLGRMMYVDPDKRSRTISLTIVCSISQLLCTLLAGCTGILMLMPWIREGITPDQRIFRLVMPPLLFGSAFTGLIVAIAFFRISDVVKLFNNRYLRKFEPIVKVLQELEYRKLLRILCLSFGRYLVFLLQYYLMFLAFGVRLTPGQTFAGISVMLLIMAVIPSLTFLSDLGLRWEASIRIVQLFSTNAAGIFAVSLGIWLINLIIPALIGSLLILRIKLFRNR